MNDQSNRRRRRRISIFMRVLLCSKIHCPSFICFCNPSSSVVAAAASHLCNPGPLKLENAHHLPPNSTTTETVSSVDGEGDDVVDGDEDENDDGQFSGKSIEATDGNQEEEEVETEDGNEETQIIALKSCLRKLSPESGNPDEEQEVVWKKKVRWMDNLGKQLVQIKEFESSDRDSDNEMNNRTCVCTIL